MWSKKKKKKKKKYKMLLGTFLNHTGIVQVMLLIK